MTMPRSVSDGGSYGITSRCCSWYGWPSVRRGRARAIGAGLLKEVILRTMQAADIAGIRALATHANDDAARAFYERFGFVPSPTDPLHLLILLKDLRRIAG